MKKALFLLIFSFPGWNIQAQINTLMPMPRSVTQGNGEFVLKENLQLMLHDAYPCKGTDCRASQGAIRLLSRISDLTGMPLSRTPVYGSRLATGMIQLRINESPVLVPGLNEGYKLEVKPEGITITAATDIGALYAMETLLQLITRKDANWVIEGCTIEDAPRFKWRGLLIDVCRHWQPIEVILRNLDGMAMSKMNVLHLHLSEDQGFRIECKTFPKLHEKGSNGNYFTQDQIRHIIRYADMRGIRVVPEFDMPGHATAWFCGHPELSVNPLTSYSIEKKFGVFDPVMDPTRETTYEFLEKFFTEMCALFPDPYFHIGGDENNGKQWDASEHVQQFKAKEKLKDNHALQAYFNMRVSKLLTENGKIMVGWDEILQPELPNNIVIQSWRGKEALVEAAQKGYDVMLSSGWYIDLCQSTEYHYLNDPIPPGVMLDADAEAHILGGEATMWAELVSPETIDSRIWPRTAAIAERLWSPSSVTDVKDMYRRLVFHSARLEMAGLLHLRNPEMMLRRAFGPENVEWIKPLIEVTEPLEMYKRHSQGVSYSTDLPLTRLPDITIPDQPEARRFSDLVDAYIKTRREYEYAELKNFFLGWSGLRDVEVVAESEWRQPQWAKLARNLSFLGDSGFEILLAMRDKKQLDPEKVATAQRRIAEARTPYEESELAIVNAFEKLFLAAIGK